MKVIINVLYAFGFGCALISLVMVFIDNVYNATLVLVIASMLLAAGFLLHQWKDHERESDE
jgi:nicotinamide riboside transporter PnuC